MTARARISAGFLLCPATPDGGHEASGGLSHSFEYGAYRLYYDGPAVNVYGETSVFIRGYVIPRSSETDGYDSPDQGRLMALLYERYGRSLTAHLKGYFLIIIFSRGRIEVFTDQVGLFRAFYYLKAGQLYLSGSAGQLYLSASAGHPGLSGLKPGFDGASLGLQSLFNRVPLHYTIFRDIFKTTWGDSFSISEGKATHIKYWSPDDLLVNDGDDPGPGIEEFAELIRRLISGFRRFLKPESSVITLTGGKDSRTILTALLGDGQKPAGLTYGDRRSRDAVYAGVLARASGIEHMVIQPPGTGEWFEAEASRIVADLNPEINIHRSHRNFAFAQAADSTGRDAAFYTGYLGGELLMGIYFDDLIFTDFLREMWKTGGISDLSASLSDRFFGSDRALTDQISERFSEMRSMVPGLSEKMQVFHGIFEIGIPHHSQDVSLSAGYWNYPYPVFLDIEFLELLFRSRYSFLHKDNSSRNLLKRHGLYSLSMQLQHILYPGLDVVPFGKRGTYNTLEYLKGPLYWSAVKGFRYVADRKKYPPSFAYGDAYRSFLEGWLEKAAGSRCLTNDYFDTGKALKALKDSPPITTESPLHKYSDIVMFYMLEQELKR